MEWPNLTSSTAHSRRVWKAEKSKSEEEKKLKQLMKERAEERQLAELQALQEQQTGKKKTDKLDWMYATPASGGGIKGEELEDYLLGKRRVDSILKGDDEKQVRRAVMSLLRQAATADPSSLHPISPPGRSRSRLGRRS